MKKIISLTSLAILVAGSASAAVANAQKSTLDEIMSKANVSYYSDFEGPSVRGLNKGTAGSDAGEAANGAKGSEIHFYNVVSPSYKITPNLKFAFQIRSKLFPKYHPTTIAASADGNPGNLVMMDPRPALSMSNVFKVGRVSMDELQVRSIIPMIAATRRSATDTAPTLLTGFSVDTGSNVQVGFSTLSQTTVYKWRTAEPQQQFLHYSVPALGYKFSDKLTLDTEYYHAIGYATQDAAWMKVQEAYFEPQLTWTASKHLAVAPFVRVHTMEAIRGDKTQVGLELWGSVF